MFSENREGKDEVKNIIPFLSKEKKLVVGTDYTSSIMPSVDEYTNTKSVIPNQIKAYHNREDNNWIIGENIMDDNKLLEIYMDKVDKDQRELREEMRERESRIEKQISDSEEREHDRMDRIEQLIATQNDKIDLLSEGIRNKLEDDKKYRHTNNIAIVLGIVATVLTMIGIYYATVSMLTDIIGVAVK